MIYKSYLVEKDIDILKHNVSLFYGENEGLKDDFKAKLKITNANANIRKFYQDEILKNENNFFDELLNMSLFGEEKIYFIEQTNDKILNLIQQLLDKLENNKIYLFADILDKKSKLRNYFEKSKSLNVIACYNDNEISLKKLILDKLKGFNGLSSENLNIIIENSGLNRAKLNNELTKVQAYFINKKIETSKLLKLLNLNENDNFNSLKDAAMSGNSSKTNRLLNFTILENDKSIFYINIINQRLNKLNEILITENKSIEEIIDTIKPQIFWKDKPSITVQAKKWSLRKIKHLLRKTIDLEVKLKSSSILDKKLLVKKLVIDICNLANA